MVCQTTDIVRTYRGEANSKYCNMSSKLLELAKEMPNLKIEVTLADMLAFHKEVISDTKRELEETVISEKAETYPNPKQDTIIKSKFFEQIFDGEMKLVMWKRLSKRQCKMSVCIYKLSCPACAK